MDFGPVRKILSYAYSRYYFDSWVRTQKLPTRLFKSRYIRSRSRIELDITYRCNLKCFNCDRSCRQAPSTEQMTVEQIQMFIKESVDKNVSWERIRVLGGEPTLHPDLTAILLLLIEYRTFAPGVQIQLITNGYGNKVDGILSTVPNGIEIENTMKTGSRNKFIPFNKAPADSLLLKNSDFSNGCWITSKCGIGLTPYGYYCCAAAGGIDRVFGFDIGRKELPSTHDTMLDQLLVFCELCGHYVNRYALTTSETMSPTWKEAYKNYNQAKPSLSLFAQPYP